MELAHLPPPPPRCSKSLTDGVPTADHERTMTVTFCQQATERVERNLTSMTASRDLKQDDRLAIIAKEVIGHGGTVTVPPVGF